jgi:hypothetical protein
VTEQPRVQVAIVHGEVAEGERHYAERKIGALLRLAPAPVLFARVTLVHEDAPSIERPVVAKGVLDVNGRPVRAHVAAASDREAIDLLEAKLRHGLETLTEHRQARRHEPAAAAPGSWRHGMLPTPRPAWFPRPVEERELVVRQSLVPHERTVAEAALDLALLDQAWMLFRELTTGSDALLADVGEGYHLVVASRDSPDVGDVGAPVRLELGAPRMAVEAALALLDETGAPYVFFVDAATGRGRVVYRRLDGHHGSVTGAGAASTSPHEATEPPVPRPTEERPMSPQPKAPLDRQDPTDPSSELTVHANIEGLQVQVRALATAIDHLCRAVEAVAPEAEPSELDRSVEEARLALGEIW